MSVFRATLTVSMHARVARAYLIADAGVPAGTLHAIAARVPAGTLTAAARVTGPDGNSGTCPLGGRSGWSLLKEESRDCASAGALTKGVVSGPVTRNRLLD